jgi:hypothetical protein
VKSTAVPQRLKPEFLLALHGAAKEAAEKRAEATSEALRNVGTIIALHQILWAHFIRKLFFRSLSSPRPFKTEW